MLKLKILIITILVLSVSNSFSNIKIKYKIENEIITNIDIEEEKKYLIFLNPNLKKLNTEQITKISENSLIREIIKKRRRKKLLVKQKLKSGVWIKTGPKAKVTLLLPNRPQTILSRNTTSAMG